MTRNTTAGALLVAVLAAAGALVGCSAPANAEDDPLAYEKSQVHTWCDGPDKVWLFFGERKGGIAVVANHPECVSHE